MPRGVGAFQWRSAKELTTAPIVPTTLRQRTLQVRGASSGAALELAEPVEEEDAETSVATSFAARAQVRTIPARKVPSALRKTSKIDGRR